MIRGLGNRKAESTIDIKINNTDADYYKYDTMAALLARWETINKDKYGKHCHNQQNCFSLFVLSVNEMLGREALY